MGLTIDSYKIEDSFLSWKEDDDSVYVVDLLEVGAIYHDRESENEMSPRVAMSCQGRVFFPPLDYGSCLTIWQQAKIGAPPRGRQKMGF